MSKLTAFFQSILMFFLSIFGYLTVTTDFNIKTMDKDSWNGKTVMFSGKEIDFDADCETVTGGNAPVFRFDDTATINLKAKVKGFTYYGIVYKSTNDVQCEMTYSEGSKTHTETFYLEKSESEKTFYSYTENYEKGKNITSLKLTNLNAGTAEFSLLGFDAFNRALPNDEIFISNDSYKIGVTMTYGGALEYMECLNGDVQAVKLSDGTVKVDRDAKAKYGGEILTSNVNLINRFDAGRFVQQSYYGTNGKKDNYVCGDYNGTQWPYNPVQGGNLNGDRSRIIDYKVTDNSIYVKCQPMDWAKSKKDIAKAYMESTYILVDDAVKCDFSIIDFSGYAPRSREQEFPAIYFIEPLNSFAYGKNGGFDYENDLEFWGDPEHADEYYWYPDNGISGFFCGEDGFGAGVYTTETNKIKAGVFMRDKENTLGKDPSTGRPTSYIAPIKELKFQSFKPISYSFMLAAGTTQELADIFANVA